MTPYHCRLTPALESGGALPKTLPIILTNLKSMRSHLICLGYTCCQTARADDLHIALLACRQNLIARHRYFLPPIIFYAGLSVKKKKFFRNFGSIATLGILGTYILFAVIAFCLYAISMLPNLLSFAVRDAWMLCQLQAALRALWLFVTDPSQACGLRGTVEPK